MKKIVFNFKQDKTLCGIQVQFSEFEIKWEIEGIETVFKHEVLTDHPIQSLTLSELKIMKNCPYRKLEFHSETNRFQGNMPLYTSFWPENYKGESKSCPNGYEIIGFAVSLNEFG